MLEDDDWMLEGYGWVFEGYGWVFEDETLKPNQTVNKVF